MTSKMTSEKCNEPSSEELCGSTVRVENFSLVGKQSTTGLTDKRRVFCSACTNAVKLQNAPSNYITREGFICSICSKTQIIPALNNDPRTVKSHCSDFLPF